MIQLRFDRGTLLLEPDAGATLPDVPPSARFDERVQRWRAPAYAYRQIILHLRQAGIAYDDHAREYLALPLTLQSERQPFPHQAEAVQHWWDRSQNGVVVLPTGAGKTFVAQLITPPFSNSTICAWAIRPAPGASFCG